MSTFTSRKSLEALTIETIREVLDGRERAEGQVDSHMDRESFPNVSGITTLVITDKCGQPRVFTCPEMLDPLRIGNTTQVCIYVNVYIEDERTLCIALREMYENAGLVVTKHTFS